MDSTPESSDQREYAHMQRKLRKFQEGSQTLRDLIEGLQDAFDHLQVAEQSWKDEFHAYWSDLEFIFSDCLERQSFLSSVEHDRVVAVVKTLDEMVTKARRWSDLELEALRAIVDHQRPDLSSDLESGLRSGFSAQQVRDIRSAIGDEILENGKTAGELNAWGEACEDFIWRIELGRPPVAPS